MDEHTNSLAEYDQTVDAILKAFQRIRAVLPDETDEPWTPSDIGDGPLRGFSRPVTADQFALQLAYQIWRDFELAPRGPLMMAAAPLRAVRMGEEPPA